MLPHTCAVVRVLSGRDWFAYTLVDHDPAINELMWQNAGMVGLDPFYRGLKWEETPAAHEAYVAEWQRFPLILPLALRASDALPIPSKEDVYHLASQRRIELRPVHQIAGRVAQLGVRVNDQGEVMQVGREPLACFVSRLEAKRASNRLSGFPVERGRKNGL